MSEELLNAKFVLVWAGVGSSDTQPVLVVAFVAYLNLLPWRPTFVLAEPATAHELQELSGIVSAAPSPTHTTHGQDEYITFSRPVQRLSSHGQEVDPHMYEAFNPRDTVCT